MKKLLWLGPLTLLFMSSLAQAFIINGHAVVKEDLALSSPFSSIVYIEVSENKNHDSSCTGTLIDRDIVVTAAHCFYDDDLRPLKRVNVFLQTLDVAKPGLVIASQKILINAKYAELTRTANSDDEIDNDYDFALILLSKPAPPSVGIASLATSDVKYSNMILMTAGYGDTVDTLEGKNEADQLHWTTLEKVSRLEGRQIDIRTSKTGPCFGDSGGPLFVLDPVSNKALLVGSDSAGNAPYAGRIGDDYDNLSTEDFQKKYPKLHVCLGTETFVNLSRWSAEIRQMIKELKP